MARDSDLDQTAQTFASIEKMPPEGIELVLLGAPDHIATGWLDRRLDEGLRDCHGLLAVMDLPNANMAWEAGLALGLSLPVAFSTEAEAPPGWVKQTPLWSALVQPRIGETARSLLARLDQWQALRQHATAGSDRVVLCPDRGAGREYRLWLARDLPGWTLVGLDQGMLPALVKQLDGVRQLAWVLLPLAQGEQSDGAHNAAAAVIAGYAAARQMDVRVFWCKGSPELADVVGRKQGFSDAEDLVVQIAKWGEGPAVDSNDPLVAYLADVRRRHAHPIPYVRARLHPAPAGAAAATAPC